jgi:D-serine deaminase-like pyridoxal phosphate-dependent protein
MLRRCKARGITLRAGLKTHKCVEAARIQFGLGSGDSDRATQTNDWKVNVSTLAEACFFLDAGLPVTDLNYHLSPTPDKLDEILEFSSKVERFSFLIDSPELLEKIVEWSKGKAGKLGCWVKVDTGAQ